MIQAPLSEHYPILVHVDFHKFPHDMNFMTYFESFRGRNLPSLRMGR